MPSRFHVLLSVLSPPPNPGGPNKCTHHHRKRGKCRHDTHNTRLQCVRLERELSLSPRNLLTRLFLVQQTQLLMQMLLLLCTEITGTTGANVQTSYIPHDAPTIHCGSGCGFAFIRITDLMTVSRKIILFHGTLNFSSSCSTSRVKTGFQEQTYDRRRP